MRRKTHTVAWALATGAAVCCPFLTSTSCGSGPASSTPDAGPDSTTLLFAGKCGDGVVNIGEQCDLGAEGGPGCDPHCNFTCIPDTLNGNALCDDHNPCNGVETCVGDKNEAGVPSHTCAKGTPPGDGTPCGNGSVCRSGMCGGAAVCGNGVAEGSEECDLGSQNGTNMGCEANCKWTCVPGDAARNCAPPNSCVGPGTCDGSTHICTPGALVADGIACGTNQVCKAGSCVSVNCGDGLVEAPEQCDFGTGNGVGTGCEPNCTFSCTLAPNNCITPDPCAGTYTCTAVTVSGAAGQKCVAGAPLAMGASCPNGGTCNSSHLCIAPNCGNGTLDPGEQCDWGSMNAAGAGCEPDCIFSCATTPLSPNVCPGFDACSTAPQTCKPLPGPGANNGQKCAPAPLLAACAGCATSSVCVNHTCKPSQCGDGCVDPPEQCDPPDGKTCDPTCHKYVCGDGVVGGAEQCDDGNTTNLDGCDSNCNFEQLQRATSLQYSNTVDAFCPLNLLGTQVLTANGLSVIQPQTDQDVAAGRTNVLFKFTGMGTQSADLSGTSGPVGLGSLGASGPQGVVDGGAPDGGGYSGTADLDWWYTVDPTTVDSSRNPTSTLSGTFVNKVLTAGPGLLRLKVNLSGSLAPLEMWNAKVTASIGAASAPTLSTGATPPGHLASENLKSGLTSFQNAGVGGSGPTGELCGNITTLSLSHVPIPPLLVMGNPMGFACDENYAATAALLDVLIHGCSLQGMGVIQATQPDQVLSTVSFSGFTPPYKLSASNGSTHAVDTCKDSSASPKTIPLATCLQGLAYSSAFTFQSDRVIIKP